MTIGLALIMPDVERPMRAQMTEGPSLMVDSALCAPGSLGLGVYLLDSDLMLSFGRYLQAGGHLQSILQVTVVLMKAPVDTNLPAVLGRYQVLKDGLRFVPIFPFERGLSYRASFDVRPLGRSDFSDILTLEFSLPRKQNSLPTKVTRIFPSSDDLPENLLRFYVCFSSPMQRGQVGAEISLLGVDGELVTDVLYRAPVELWDKSMQHLTILLDPGRLKRGVGPNRELGQPLKPGEVYMLAVGAGMTDLSGSQLPETVYKQFRVTDAVRERIAVERWEIVPPVTNSCQALVLMFPRSLDWALLLHTIAVASVCGQLISGRVEIDQCERQWSFTPIYPWIAGSYRVHVASSLEDVCGNSVISAFDRPLRPGSNLAYDVGTSSISFDLA